MRKEEYVSAIKSFVNTEPAPNMYTWTRGALFGIVIMASRDSDITSEEFTEISMLADKEESNLC